MENFWRLLNRRLKGNLYLHGTIHLFRYLEQAFRYNNRKATDAERFSAVMKEIVGRRVTHKQIIGKTEDTAWMRLLRISSDRRAGGNLVPRKGVYERWTTIVRFNARIPTLQGDHAAYPLGSKEAAGRIGPTGKGNRPAEREPQCSRKKTRRNHKKVVGSRRLRG
jgi:hypothetical protein